MSTDSRALRQPRVRENSKNVMLTMILSGVCETKYFTQIRERVTDWSRNIFTQISDISKIYGNIWRLFMASKIIRAKALLGILITSQNSLDWTKFHHVGRWRCISNCGHVFQRVMSNFLQRLADKFISNLLSTWKLSSHVQVRLKGKQKKRFNSEKLSIGLHSHPFSRRYIAAIFTCLI